MFGALALCCAASFFGVGSLVFHASMALLPGLGMAGATTTLISAAVLASLSCGAVLFIVSAKVFMPWIDWLEPRLRGTKSWS
jgi:hypothetical protein